MDPEIQIRAVSNATELREVFLRIGRQFDRPRDETDLSLKQLLQHYPADASLMIVATGSRQFAGGALALRDDNGDVLLKILGVDRAFRGRGVGTLLVKQIEHHAGLIGAARIYFGIIKGTEEFYRSLGYFVKRTGAVKHLAGVAAARYGSAEERQARAQLLRERRADRLRHSGPDAS
jgi:GNAT superfamily N-acetyltransferase